MSTEIVEEANCGKNFRQLIKLIIAHPCRLLLLTSLCFATISVVFMILYSIFYTIF